MTFDFGVLYKKKQIKNANQIIKEGIAKFNEATSLTA